MLHSRLLKKSPFLNPSLLPLPPFGQNTKHTLCECGIPGEMKKRPPLPPERIFYPLLPEERKRGGKDIVGPCTECSSNLQGEEVIETFKFPTVFIKFQPWFQPWFQPRKNGAFSHKRYSQVIHFLRGGDKNKESFLRWQRSYKVELIMVLGCENVLHFHVSSIPASHPIFPKRKLQIAQK